MADTPTTTEIKQQKGLGGFTDDPSQRLKPSKTIPPKFGSSQSAAPDYAPDPSRKDRPSKSYGLSEGDQGDPHKYLGHLANDSVVSQGHNVGAPKGKSSEAHQVARAGFRRLPGTAANQIGHAKYGDAHDELPPPRHEREAQRKKREEFDKSMTSPSSPIMDPQPRAISDIKLSAKHHRESIANDEKHICEHKASIENHKSLLKKRVKQLPGGKRK
jgi:hypothetical protein